MLFDNKRNYIKIPEEILIKLQKYKGKFGYPYLTIQLKNKKIIRNIAINKDGYILGKVVGGWDGIKEISLEFTTDDIEAVKSEMDILSKLGIKGWLKK